MNVNNSESDVKYQEISVAYEQNEARAGFTYVEIPVL
jgi:hypothetical protein